MSKGGSLGQIAQTRCLESMFGHGIVRLQLGAANILCVSANIVKLVVGEIPARMTGRTARLAIEQHKAAYGTFIKSLCIAINPTVKGSPTGDNRALVSRNGSENCLAADAFSPNSRLNQLRYSSISLRSLMITGNLPFISTAAVIGPAACSSSVAALPSQNKGFTHAILRVVGAWRSSCF